MAKDRRHRGRGRVTPKGTRAGYRPVHSLRDDYAPEPPPPDLIRDVRGMLAEPHPFDLVGFVSSLLAVVDPRGRSPFELPREARGSLDRETLVESFVEVDLVETTAIVAMIAALTPDERERDRLERVVDRRGHRLPAWLAALRHAEVRSSMEMTDAFGDGENLFIGVELPTGHHLSAVVLVDHNLGTLVKDGFVVPQPVESMVARMHQLAAGHDDITSFADVDPAEMRARVTEAIETAAMTVPPFETETWPVSRAAIEWMVRLLPEGGRGYERREWTERERDELAARFFSSPFGAAIREDDRHLLESILWFACSYGPADPLRWSPIAVELLLVDFLPRKVVAPPELMAGMPDVLRRFVRFAHAERGMRKRLTDETLAAIDRWTPAFAAATGAKVRPSVFGDYRTSMRDLLEEQVGGADALRDLDAQPLPDEAFVWDGIADDARDRVAHVLELCDGWCDELLDVEYRTAVRRLLARVARDAPAVFRGRGRDDTAAGAVVWTVGQVNDLFRGGRPRMTQKAFFEAIGLSSSVAQRARTLLRVAGFDSSRYDLSLHSPAFLVSTRRAAIIHRRDDLDR